ncbi:GntR family transcriptional regulator [Paractinoplanes ferrugineus]|uniref:GntR-family transcriptional regulator n=1 Tax=Paractinoplanes ferrugineus TaxID=113564 RepID=A0A919MFE3_9ACTN|nr:GntR family transcriptional regulator [Actinoplanes ferrugineus]GIE10485.1 putative GntR-family transcriptional regulator [Actinoplanes ferrugineus]
MSRPEASPTPLTGRRRRIDDASRVRDLLRSAITSGQYGLSLLPSEPELMLEFAVGRNVIRDALDMLRAEGLIERVQGTGTFVLVTKAEHRFDRVHAINDSVETPRLVGGAFLAWTVITAPRPVAELFGLAAGSECAVLQHVTTIGGETFSVTTSYVTTEVAGRLAGIPFNGDFYVLLERAGHVIRGAELVVEATVADALAAEQLGVAAGLPVLQFTRKLYDPDGRPLELAYVRCRGDRFNLRIKLPRTRREGQS